MAPYIAHIATGFAVLFAVGSLWFVLAGNYFVAGTLLTFVAFSIYFRETSTA